MARLLLDNFAHIKTYWIMTGLKLAQIALFFGANDMDGTVVEEVISLLSGASFGQAVAKDELIRVIRDMWPHVPWSAMASIGWCGGSRRPDDERYASDTSGFSIAIRSTTDWSAEAPCRGARWATLAGDMGLELVPWGAYRLNRMLLEGGIDLGPISSIAYARNHRQLLLSRYLSISSFGAVDSIQLVTRRPWEEISSVALTTQSATSVALLKTILKLRFGREVAYSDLEGPVDEALTRRTRSW